VWPEVRELVIDQLDAVDDAALALLTPGRTCDAPAAARVAHRLAGHLGSFGAPEASEDAWQLEQLFHRASGGPARPEDILAIADLSARLREHVATIDRALSAEPTAEPTETPTAIIVLPSDRARGAWHADVAVIEDDPVTAELIAHTLGQHGLTTVVLSDGEEAVAALAGKPPKLRAPVILLDVDLPSLNGLDVLRRLADASVLTESKVIMLTARSGERETLQAFDLGAADHVAKPFSGPVLVRRVKLALG